MQDEVDDNNSLRCPECGKDHKKQSYLLVHMRSHTGERPFTCNVCGKGYITANNLKRHKRIHTGEKPYVCSFCGQRFSDIGGHKVHILRHKAEKTYKCEICHRGFNTSNDLGVHLKCHSARAFLCEVCGKSFLFKRTLERHVSNVHLKVKPTCKLCGSQFSEKYLLTEHLKYHLADEKLHACPKCDRKFFEELQLKQHLHTHLPRNLPCYICGKFFATQKNLSSHIGKHKRKRASEINDDELSNGCKVPENGLKDEIEVEYKEDGVENRFHSADSSAGGTRDCSDTSGFIEDDEVKSEVSEDDDNDPGFLE